MHKPMVAAARGALMSLCIASIASCEGEAAPGEALFDNASVATIPVGREPVDVALGDLDGDGDDDIVIASRGSADLTILLGDGSRRFGPAASSPIDPGIAPNLIVLADFDKDARLDLALANHDENTVRVLRGDGAGGFASVAGSPFVVLTDSTAHNHGLAAADVNGDGHLDLVTANHDADNVSVLLGDGAGGFTAAPGSPFAAGDAPYPLAAGDLDADGRAEVVTPNVGGRSISVLSGGAPGGAVLASARTVPLEERPWFATLARVDRDDAVDIIATCAETDGVAILLNDGHGAFERARTLRTGDVAIEAVAADMNGDNRSDLVMSGPSAAVAVLLGDGAGDFTAAPGSPFAVGRGPWAVAVGDLDANGRPDVVTANAESNTISILFGRTAGSSK